MKRKKWVSVFLTAALLMTGVGNTGNPVFASEVLEEETAEGLEKAVDAITGNEKAADVKAVNEKAANETADAKVTDAGASEGKEETEEPEAADQASVEKAEENSASKADGLDTDVKVKAEEVDSVDEEQFSQKTDTLEGSLEKSEVSAAETEQAAGETVESAENTVLESPDLAEDEETTEEEVVPQAGDIASGSSGNITWVIDASGKLTVSGEGAFSSELWKDYRDKVISVDLSGVDTSHVTDMQAMFHECSSLKSLDLSGLDTRNVTDMRGMFYGCSNLQSLDLSGLDTSNVISMDDMFAGCNSLETLDLSGLDTNNVTSMIGLFRGCNSLRSLDLSGLDTSNVTNMESMFISCISLESLNLSGLDTSNVTDMSNMFAFCSSLGGLNLSGLDTKNVTSMKWMFEYCSSLKNIDLSSFNTKSVTDMEGMFKDCSNLESLNVSGVDTSKVTNMVAMFEHCSSLINVDLSDFDTKNVTDMEGMFQGCSNLKSLNLSGMDTGKVTNMSAMFRYCGSLKNIDLSSFDTRNVTNMEGMFQDCINLENLDLSGLDTSKVINMHSMFDDCSSLENLNLSELDTRNVTDMSGMFANCYSLRSLDLSSFDTSKADVNLLLVGNGNLTTIYTPYKTKDTIDLNPLGITYDKNLYTWYLPDGTEVTEIPANLDHSVMLVRRKNPKIITTTTDLNMEDVIRVKYVPYSYTVETNNTESDNIVTYSLVEGRLAEGLSLYPATGEIYGVPLETGSFPIRVKAEFSNPEYFPSYADLVLTVIDNTDGNVFGASDPGYELVTPVGEVMSSVYVLTQTGDQLFVSAGAYSEFIDFWLNGQKLIEGEDYTKESGSTRITIRSQTFLNKADKEGVNTLAAEFREGGLLTNPLRRTAQNFRLRIQQNSGTSGNESSGSGYTGGGDSGDSESTIRTTTFAIRLVDAAGNALGGYTLELHSTPKVTKTNQRGIAVFRNVEEGPHTLYVKDARGNILASKVFTLGIGEALALNGDQITAKDGAAFTLQLQMTGSTLTLLQVQEGDVYRVIPAQTGDEANPELWLALLALLGAIALAGGLYRKRRNYV